MRLEDLNTLAADAAHAALLRCCGSTSWARHMTARRPFRSEAEMANFSDTVWAALEPVDWLEAFAAQDRKSVV